MLAREVVGVFGLHEENRIGAPDFLQAAPGHQPRGGFHPEDPIGISEFAMVSIGDEFRRLREGVAVDQHVTQAVRRIENGALARAAGCDGEARILDLGVIVAERRGDEEIVGHRELAFNLEAVADALLGGPQGIVKRLRDGPWSAGFMDGLNAGSVGLMAGVLVQLAQAAMGAIWTWPILLVAAILLIRTKVNPAWIVIGAGLIGILAHAAPK